MRHALIVLSVLVSIALSATSLPASDTVLLKDGWLLQSAAKMQAKGDMVSTAAFKPEGWYPVSVPTTVLAALVKNGVFPDPFYGENLKAVPGFRKAPWLVMPADSPFRPSWWYRTRFTLPAAYRGRNLVLHFDGINYKANIWLNGQRIADSSAVIGMFRRFAFDITGVARIGDDNYLAVETIGPGKEPDIEYDTKQIEATTGWDDHNQYPPDMNTGIWQDVYVTATGPLRMANPYVATHLNLPRVDVAHLTITVEVTNVTNQPVTGDVAGAIERRKFSQAVALAPNETKVVRFSPPQFPELRIENPRVWWPNPIGPQELYDLKLTAKVGRHISDSLTQRFGIREATTEINDEGWRVYKVNGRRVLIRGGAWMTSDMLLRLDHRRYDALVRYAKHANLNMLRSEGFSIRETDDFFNVCDEYGVMVTQQIFGRSIPDEDLAIACVKDTILRIRNHPSLVHFLGHDETFPTPRLDQAYREIIARYTPERTYQPHSGAFALADRWKTGGTRTGSRQVWTYAWPGHYYVDKERGAWGFAQSGGIGGVIAPIESMRRMVPASALWPPWTDMWSFHTVTQGGHYFDAMLEALNARYGPATGIEDCCLKGQALNYESARGMYEAYARNKYSATGITAWKYDAAWPASPTWQYIDWYLQAGGAYYGAKKACEPLHVQYSYDDQSVWVVNTYSRDYANLTVTAKVYNLDATEKYARSATVKVGADGKTQAFVIQQPEGLSKTHFLCLTLGDSSGREISNNFYWLSTVPDVPGTQGYTPDREFYIHPKSVADYTDLSTLPKVDVKTAWSIGGSGEEKKVRVTVENAGRSIAFLVHLAVIKGEGGAEVTPTFWSDNYFSLLPGEKREVTAAFAAEELGGAQPALRVDGWNVRPVVNVSRP